MDWGLVVLLVWVAGMVFLQVPAIITLYRREEGEDFTDFIMFFGIVISFIWAWPLIIPIYYGWQFVKDDNGR